MADSDFQNYEAYDDPTGTPTPVKTALETKADNLADVLAGVGGGGGGGVEPVLVLEKTADQALNAEGNTIVTWDSEVKDDDGLHESVTNPSRVTAVAEGTLLFVLTCHLNALNAAAQSDTLMALLKNGSVHKYFSRGIPQQAAWSYQGAVSVEASPTDYFEVQYTNGSGAKSGDIRGGVNFSQLAVLA